MKNKWHLGAWLLLLALSGCLDLGGNAPPPTLYLLQAKTAAPAAPLPPRTERRPVISVATVELPDYLDRSQLVVRQTPGQVRFLADVRWAEPLESAVQRVLAADLQRAWPEALIVAGLPPAGERAQLSLQLQLERFEGGPGERARLEGEWLLLAAASGQILATDRVQLETPWSGGSADLVQALDTLLGRLASDLAAALPPAAEEGAWPGAGK